MSSAKFNFNPSFIIRSFLDDLGQPKLVKYLILLRENLKIPELILYRSNLAKYVQPLKLVTTA